MTKLFYGLLVLFVLVSCVDDDDSNELAKLAASNRLGTGDSARDFLTEENFKAVVFEVVYVEDYPPSDAALDNLAEFTNKYCHKSAGVEITKRAIPAPGKEYYTISQVDSLEQELRSQYNREGRLAVFVFYLDGTYKSEKQSSVASGLTLVLGVSYRNTSFVVFKNSIDKLSSSRSFALESTVLRHEFSHLLGLVNVGTKMQTNHIDPENGHHCIVESCLMNYQVESGWQFSRWNMAPQIPLLDSQCIADLRANGGK
ncbi:membrane metalloprotease [Galbibacter sp.]|jgi:hypothetical protein|uniref:membrane metalloprotease n=1 Tax=Galbibacter sp. TaxID=2918471 RepID=UPI003A8EB5CD